MVIMNDLQPLVDEPVERLSVEYKKWLDISTNHGRAVLAKAAIALANHGGGYIVVGFSERDGFLVSEPKSDDLSDITQDRVNGAVARYAEPPFHCGVQFVECTKTGVQHPVVIVAEDMSVPIRSKSGQEPLSQNTYYIRRLGPSSEGPQTGAEWDAFLRRVVQAKKDEMLNAIRVIFDGRAGAEPSRGIVDELQTYCRSAYDCWQSLSAQLRDGDPAQFPDGYWEVAFASVGSNAMADLTQVRVRLEEAGRVMYSGWPVFLILEKQGMRPEAHREDVVTWLGAPEHGTEFDNPQYCDFWSASRDGKLYLIRGYTEDGRTPGIRYRGRVLDVGLSIRRFAEALSFAGRFYSQFEDATQIPVHCRCAGLVGRALSDLRFHVPIAPDFVCHVPSISSEAVATVSEIEDNLAEVLQPLLHRIFEQFNFYDLPIGRVQTAVQEMRNQHLQ